MTKKWPNMCFEIYKIHYFCKMIIKKTLSGEKDKQEQVSGNYVSYSKRQYDILTYDKSDANRKVK